MRHGRHAEYVNPLGPPIAAVSDADLRQAFRHGSPDESRSARVEILRRMRNPRHRKSLPEHPSVRP